MLSRVPACRQAAVRDSRETRYKVDYCIIIIIHAVSMKQTVITDKAAKATGPFSQGIRSGPFIYTSGQIPITKEGKLVDGPIETQTHQVMKNLEAVLEAAGVTFTDVVKASVFITDMADFPKMNEIYKSYLLEPYPARETLCVKELHMGAKLEISMIAIVP